MIPAFQNLHFHDSSLDGMAVEGSTVRLVFESVFYPPLQTEQDKYPLVSLTLWIDGVTAIVENDQAVQTLAIQGSYGEVFSFGWRGAILELAVSWTYFGPGPGARSEFSLISFRGPSLAIRCGPCTDQEPEGP